MRKTYLGALLLAGTLAFTACQNETIIYLDENGNPIENVELKEGEGILKIAVSSTDANSRAVRPVGSSAAANNVNTVMVYVFKKTGGDSGISSYTFDNTIDLANTSDANITGADGIFTITGLNPKAEHENTDINTHIDQTKSITLKNLQKSTSYKFLAVGYDTTNPYGNNPNPTHGTTTLADFIQTTSNTKEDYAVEELFAGVSEECATSSEKAAFQGNASVTITRQVAGMLAYFTNIPYKIGEKVVKYVRVYANKEFTTFKYPALLLTNSDFNGVGANSSADKDEKFLVMDFNLSEISTGNDETKYTFENWSNGKPDLSSKAPFAEGYTEPDNIKLKENSIFGGRYLIPYDNHYSENTLTVELQDENSTALKTLRVYTDKSATDDGNNKYNYDIRCNNFYSIGTKTDTDSTDPDKPIDLSGNTDIVVTINDAWKVLHNMGVEE